MSRLSETIRPAILCMLILGGGAMMPLAAQQLAAGAVVRWYDAPSGGRRMEAIVTGATPDSLFLQAAGGPAFRIAPAANPGLEVRGDRHSRWKKAMNGAIIGAGIGLVFGFAAGATCDDTYFGCSGTRGDYAARGALGARSGASSSAPCSRRPGGGIR